jgi:hypothetical protein
MTAVDTIVQINAEPPNIMWCSCALTILPLLKYTVVLYIVIGCVVASLFSSHGIASSMRTPSCSNNELGTKIEEWNYQSGRQEPQPPQSLRSCLVVPTLRRDGRWV